MKKLFRIIPLVFLLCFTFACQNKGEEAKLEQYKAQIETEKQNEAVVRQFFAAADAQNVNRLIELLASGAVVHGAVPQEDLTAENAAQFLQPFYKTFPDLNHSIDDIFAKGDKVVARILIQATQKGEFMGLPPTGNRISYLQIAVFQIVDGKIKEAWRVTDSLGMMQQLGFELKPKEAEKK